MSLDQPNSMRTENKIRSLSSFEMGVQQTANDDGTLPIPDNLDVLDQDDKFLANVVTLLNDGFAGVIFSGPPGTSKSWYAKHIAWNLVEFDERRVRFTQFHASYQYEDFVEGYVPIDGGFRLEKKHLLEMCDIAEENRDSYCVLVIDELSRCDPGRVFGEALTYIETSRRDEIFHLASGTQVSIPPNLVFLATMNPMDRSVDEVDAAFDRRFAKVAMEPSLELLDHMLSQNNMDAKLKERLLEFYRTLLSNDNPYAHVGHAYFYRVTNREELWRLWNHQLRFYLEKAFRLDPESFKQVEIEWLRIFNQPESSV